jgi:hypothetical protein
MRTLRTLHLYLGSLFAPALLLLAVSGGWQVFRLNDARKDGYTPPAFVAALSAIHKDQVLPPARHGQGVPMQWFLLGASVGLTLTTCLGIIMAYRMTRKPVLVTALLLVGTLTPAVFLTTLTKPAPPRPAPERQEAAKPAAPAAPTPAKP